VEAKKVLSPFRKENQKEFDIILEEEYNSVYPKKTLLVLLSLILQGVLSQSADPNGNKPSNSNACST